MEIKKGTAIIFFVAGAVALALCIWANYNRKELIHINVGVKYDVNSLCNYWQFHAPPNMTNCNAKVSSCDKQPTFTCNNELMRCFDYSFWNHHVDGCVPISRTSSGYVICHYHQSDIVCENLVRTYKMAVIIGCILATLCLLAGLAFCRENSAFSILMSIVTACCGTTLILIFSIYFVYEVLIASIVVLAAAIFGLVCVFNFWNENYDSAIPSTDNTEKETKKEMKKEKEKESDNDEKEIEIIILNVLRESLKIGREARLFPRIILCIVILYTVGTFLACSVLMGVFINFSNPYYILNQVSMIVMLIHTYCLFAFMFILIVFKIISPCEIRICIICGDTNLYIFGIVAIACGVIGIPLGLLFDLIYQPPEIDASFAIRAIEGSFIYLLLMLLIVYRCYKAGCFERVRS